MRTNQHYFAGTASTSQGLTVTLTVPKVRDTEVPVAFATIVTE
jgi:hypothetical protein